jgi:hypothetical protein
MTYRPRQPLEPHFHVTQSAQFPPHGQRACVANRPANIPPPAAVVCRISQDELEAQEDAVGAERERVEGFGRSAVEGSETGDWYSWGPYLSERQWGTVREDYSGDGQAWSYLPHDHARSRAYRWGEDGLAVLGQDVGDSQAVTRGVGC